MELRTLINACEYINEVMIKMKGFSECKTADDLFELLSQTVESKPYSDYAILWRIKSKYHVMKMEDYRMCVSVSVVFR